MYFGKAEMNRLTVGAAIELQTHTNPSLSAPVHWNEANVAGQNGMLKLVANHAFAVYISLKCLNKKHTEQTTSPFIFEALNTLQLWLIIVYNPSAPLGHRYYYTVITLLPQLSETVLCCSQHTHSITPSSGFSFCHPCFHAKSSEFRS